MHHAKSHTCTYRKEAGMIGWLTLEVCLLNVNL